jgi:2-dehydropantoate 2-reductase
MPPLQPRSIAVIGAGGVGALLAGMLARSGHDVRVLARGATLTAIREHGIHLRGPDQHTVAPIARAADDVAALGGVVDIVLVAVKAWQLTALGPRLAPIVGDRTVVVPLQNGVEASEQLATALGDARVLGGVARVIAWADRPGAVHWMGAPPALTIGSRVPGPNELVESCAAALRAGGIDIAVSKTIERARWSKFLFIAPYSAVGAVERAPLGVIRKAPQARVRLQASMFEIAALAAARGVVLPPDAVAVALQRLDELPPDATASMHRDIVEGRPSELHELIGAVVRLGRESGVATPVSAELYAQLEPLERKARGQA